MINIFHDIELFLVLATIIAPLSRDKAQAPTYRLPLFGKWARSLAIPEKTYREGTRPHSREEWKLLELHQG